MILLALLIGWALCTTVVCGSPSVARWQSMSSTSPVQWETTPAVQAEGADQVHMVVTGTGGSKSATYAAMGFHGTTTLEPGTKLYAFFSRDAADSALVEDFLANTPPESWKTIKEGPWTPILKIRDNFLEVEVGQNGRIHIFLDELRSPELKSMRLLTLANRNGTVLDRLTAGG
jgi:hypothetical protein